MTKLHNITMLPGATVSPEVVLARTMAKLSRIKAVAIIIQWDDESMACDWSSMKTSHLCMAQMVFNYNVTHIAMNNEPLQEPFADD